MRNLEITRSVHRLRLLVATSGVLVLYEGVNKSEMKL
jgi:hypothetical protein